MSPVIILHTWNKYFKFRTREILKYSRMKDKMQVVNIRKTGGRQWDNDVSKSNSVKLHLLIKQLIYPVVSYKA